MRDAGRADPVAVGDRGQALHVAAEDVADGLRLGLAQLRELVGDVRDRAVLLAQLLGAVDAVLEQGQRPHGRGVPLGGEDPRQRLGRRELGLGRHDHLVVALDERDPASGELHDGLVAAGLRQVAERLHREVVVLLVEVLAPGLGDREELGRPASAAGRRRARLTRLERALGEQVVEVAAYGGGRQREPLREVGRGRRTADQDRPDDALTRRLVARRQGPLEFHNTSVPLLPGGLQVRVTLPGASVCRAPEVGRRDDFRPHRHPCERPRVSGGTRRSPTRRTSTTPAPPTTRGKPHEALHPRTLCDRRLDRGTRHRPRRHVVRRRPHHRPADQGRHHPDQGPRTGRPDARSSRSTTTTARR